MRIATRTKVKQSQPKSKTKVKTNKPKKPFVPYQEYIRSDIWQKKQKDFLKASKNRCAFTGLTIGKKVKGQYKPYSMHHCTYDNLGNEKLWIDVLPVGRFIHDFIIHGLLSCGKRPSQQKSYPNLAQKTFHQWCKIPHNVRRLFLGLLLLNLIF